MVQTKLPRLIIGLPLSLQQLAHQSLNGELHQLLALWPYWLARRWPLPPSILNRVALALLCGSWAATLRDAYLDGEMPAYAGQLSRALGMQSWRMFVRLGISHRLLHALESRMVAAYRHELAARALDGCWQPRQLQTLTAQWVCNRAAGWHLAQLAPLTLADLPPADPAWRALTGALNRLILARQLRDDALDLAIDLNAGRAGWLIRLIATAIWRDDGPLSPLDRQRIAGRWLLDGGLRQRVAKLHAQLCAGAAQGLAPYSGALPRLRDVMTAEQQAGQTVFATVPSFDFSATGAPLRDSFGTVDAGVERSASLSQRLLAPDQH
ncbi:hypothetical protein [Chloroflexus islandicus]|uniref:hypothetical protein n=1 Tax=Chloroflexus islandicus TaxID=1707952 RepID=UPI0012E7906B|nr:hypothetical protein [Chloroflexus islandicus]